MAKNTVIVDERPAVQGLLWSLAPTRTPAAPRDTTGPAPSADLLFADVDAASTGGRAAASAATGRVPTPHLDLRPYTPERIQEVFGPFLR